MGQESRGLTMTGEEIGEKWGLDERKLFLDYPSCDAINTYNPIMKMLYPNFNYDVSELLPKVKIPRFVADYIDYCKSSNIGVGTAMQPEYMTDDMPDEVDRWLTDNSRDTNIKREELFARAWLYGYEIEEKIYALPMEGTEWLAADGRTHCHFACFLKDHWSGKNNLKDIYRIAPSVLKVNGLLVSQSQIDVAPEWVKVVAKNKIKVNLNDDRWPLKEPLPIDPTKEPKPIDNRLKESDENE